MGSIPGVMLSFHFCFIFTHTISYQHIPSHTRYVHVSQMYDYVCASIKEFIPTSTLNEIVHTIMYKVGKGTGKYTSVNTMNEIKCQHLENI